MPTSNLFLAPYTCELVAGTNARRVLEVGPGHGKYGVLLREYAGVETVDAIEAWEPYVDEHRLAGIYDTVTVGDGFHLEAEQLAGYDCVLLADVLEHVPKPVGQAFLSRCGCWVVVSTPTRWFQQDHDVPTERHRSLWSLDDFRGRGEAARTYTDHSGLVVRLRPLPGGAHGAAGDPN